jgi:hypothetical protein
MVRLGDVFVVFSFIKYSSAVWLEGPTVFLLHAVILPSATNQSERKQAKRAT